MRVTSVVVSNSLILFSAIVFAQSSVPNGLPNFIPGKYNLQEGLEDQCGTGDFEVRDGGTNIGLGVYHGLDTDNKTEKMSADIPEEAGCVYETKNSRAVKADVTTVTSEETLRCDKTVRHVLNRTAVITKEKISLDVAQKGNAEFGELEPSFGYRCVWVPAAKPKS